jgi:hypothetical protein
VKLGTMHLIAGELDNTQRGYKRRRYVHVSPAMR